MKNRAFQKIIILLFFILSFGPRTVYADGGGVEPLSGFRNLYFSGIGNNDLTSVGLPKFSFSEADVFSLRDFFRKDSFFIKNSSTSKFFPFILFGENADLDHLGRSLDTIARKATKDDAFIFYYNGIAGKLQGNRLNSSGGMLVHEFSNDNITDQAIYNTMVLKGNSAKDQLTTLWLKNKLDLIPCENIVLIIDADNADKIAYDLMNDLADKNSLLYKLKGKKIRIIYPEGGLIYESQANQSGDFVYTLTHTPGVTLTDYFNTVTPVLSGKLSMTRQASFKNSQYVYATDFAQFLSIKESVLKNVACETNTTRSELDRDGETPAYTKKEVVNYALLIGTDVYDTKSWRHLNNPVFDAVTLAKTLKTRFGFDTTLLINPRGNEILQAIDNIRTNIKFDSVYSQLLIFFAGHGGWEESSPGFIVPRDAQPKEQDKFRRSYLKLSEIRSMVSQINCPHILVMIDACYGGTFDELISNSSGPRDEEADKNSKDRQFIERTLKPRSRLYLTSGGKEKVEDGTPNSHSPFVKVFLDELEKKYQFKAPLHFDVLKGSFIDAKLKPEPRSGTFDNSDHEPGGAFIFIPK
jgi:hypothetical protein